MPNPLLIEDQELVRPPLARCLATGKNIVVFNIIASAKTIGLNTGRRINYHNELYEVMNREVVESSVSYAKFNCVRFDFHEN